MEMNVETTKVMRISRQIMIDQKQLENVEYSSYLGSMMINNVRCTCEIKSRITMAATVFNKLKTISPAN
jgi:hypothetical protein